MWSYKYLRHQSIIMTAVFQFQFMYVGDASAALLMPTVFYVTNLQETVAWFPQNCVIYVQGMFIAVGLLGSFSEGLPMKFLNCLVSLATAYVWGACL